MLGAQDTIGCLARVIFFKTRRLELESSFQRTKLDLVRKKACKDIFLQEVSMHQHLGDGRK